MKKIEFTQLQIIEITKLYIEDQLSIKKIANKFDCSYSAMRIFLKNINIKLRPKKRYKYSCNDKFLNKLDTHNKSYFIGIMITDGSVSDSKRILLRQSGNHGMELINYIKNILNFSGNITEFQPKPCFILKSKKKTYPQKNYSIKITSTELVKKLAIFGIVPRKTYITKYPKKLPDRFIHSFLRGCIDGDGWVIFTKEHEILHIEIGICGTEKLIREVYNKIPIKGNVIQNSQFTWSIRWKRIDAIKIGKLIFDKRMNTFQSIKFRKFWKYLEFYELVRKTQKAHSYLTLKEISQNLIKPDIK